MNNLSSSNNDSGSDTALVTEEGTASLENDEQAEEEAQVPRRTTQRLLLPGRSPTDDATSPNNNNHNNAKNTTTLEHALSFGCGLGSSMGYIATLSSLVYFKMLYGPNSFVYLNIAVYFPLLPISLAQARWDQYYDVQFTSRTTFFVRGMVGFLLNLCGTYGIQKWHDKSSIGTVIFLALLQGTGGAIIFGTLNQIASFVSASGGGGTGDDRSFQTAVSAGVQASALVVWVVSLGTGFGVHEADCFAAFMATIGWMQVVCLGFFLWLLRARPPVAAAMRRRDSSLRLLVLSDEADRIHISDSDDLFQDPETDNIFESRLDEPLLSSEAASSESISASEMSFGELWHQTKDCGWILMGTLIPSFLVGSWFTHVDTDWMGLASVLFYIRIGSDLGGRLATIWIPPSHVSSLQRLTALRLVLVVAFFVNARQSLPGLQGRASDGLSMILVAMIAFFSGYLVTGAFQLAPTCLETENQTKHVAKQASLLTVAFSVSAVGGLLLSFCFLALGV